MFDPISVVIVATVLLFALTVHEASHALAGTLCGDDTALKMGRLTLNPIAHIDPIGTIILPMIMLFTTGFVVGWAKPVPFNPNRLRNHRLDPVKIALAGPASNLVLALGGILFARVAVELFGGAGEMPPILAGFLITFVFLNLLLMLFNLLPVPPLDGHYVLAYFLPPAGKQLLQQIGPFGIIIALILARPLLGNVFPVVQAWSLNAMGM